MSISKEERERLAQRFATKLADPNERARIRDYAKRGILHDCLGGHAYPAVMGLIDNLNAADEQIADLQRENEEYRLEVKRLREERK